MTAYKNRNNPNMQKAAVPENDEDEYEEADEDDDD